MSRARLLTAQTEELGTERLDELNTLCESAFRIPFAFIWERVGPGIHVIAELEGQAVAHAMLVDRRLYLGHEADLAIDAGYIENVATLPTFAGQGYATAVMREVGRILDEEYAVGALATRSHAFYERLDWQRWSGPTSVRMPDGERVRSVTQDGAIMVRRTPRTHTDLDPAGAIAVDWRPGESW